MRRRAMMNVNDKIGNRRDAGHVILSGSEGSARRQGERVPRPGELTVQPTDSPLLRSGQILRYAQDDM